MTERADATVSAPVPPTRQKTFLGHPRGLFVLFFTEMWERFSYYGMRALLVLYMTSYLVKDPEKAATVFGFEALRKLLEMGFGPLDVQPLASQIYGLYTGFVYLTPFFGGILADKVWGQRKTVYIGGILMAVGHFLMAFESLFLPAMFFLILGNGAFKPNISTQVGTLYPQGDSRRDGAFTLFYMGINLGAFFSPLVCGTLGQKYGWHWGFGMAGVGMIAGLCIYHCGRRLLPPDPHEALEAQQASSVGQKTVQVSKVLGGLFGVVVLFFAILILPGVWKAAIGILIAAGVVFAISRVRGEDRHRVIILCLVCLGAVAFWSIFEQQGNTLQLWADEKTDWHFFGFDVPSTWYQAFNPFFIFAFAPLLNLLWSLRAQKGKTSSSVRKMGVGCVLCGLAYVVMILAARVVGDGPERGSLLWLAGTTWVFTMGELYLSPIGLSFFSKISPPRMLSMMMGVWHLSSFFGNYMSGYVGSFYSRMPKEDFFLMLCVIGVIVGALFFVAEFRIRKFIGDV
ncbi:MAG: peptide MFS transporter [Acidobacteriota bacterium]|jgi:POT family proton-dependent oligopeptide transporter|nr:peptide MFS transporter [Acidobacteriota bacterium]